MDVISAPMCACMPAFFGREMKSRRAVNAVAIEQRHGGHSIFRGMRRRILRAGKRRRES